MPPKEWFVRNGTDIIGPVSSQILRQFAQSGLVNEASEVSLDGTKWVPATKVNGLDLRPVFAEIVTSETETQTNTRPPWNPTTIALLGLLFSPVWSAVMAALNASRLKSPQSAAVPILIFVASFVVDFVAMSLFGSMAFSFMLAFVTVGILWLVVLRPQSQIYQTQAPLQDSPNWWAPILCGIPLVMLSLAAIFMPLEPRQVCERLFNAKDAETAKQYSTSRLWPLLSSMDLYDDEGETPEFEFLDEAYAPEHIGGYLVAFRIVMVHDTIDGVCHLVDYGNGWKVDDLYFTGGNGLELEQWQPMSAARPEDHKPNQTQPSRPIESGEPLLWVTIAKLVGSKGVWKYLGLLILLIVGGIQSLWRLRRTSVERESDFWKGP